MRETQVRSQGQEDPLEKEMATHSSILAWKIPWTRSLADCTVHGVTKNTAERLALSLFLSWSAAAGGARTHLPAGSKCDPAFAAKR